MDRPIERPHESVRARVEALNFAIAGMSGQERNAICAIAAKFFGILSSRRGGVTESDSNVAPLDPDGVGVREAGPGNRDLLVEYLSAYGVHEQSEFPRGGGGMHNCGLLTSGHENICNDSRLVEWRDSLSETNATNRSGGVDDNRCIITTLDSDLVSMEQVLAPKYQHLANRTSPQSSDAGDRTFETDVEKLATVSAVNLKVPEFSFKHDSSPYLTGATLSDSDGGGVNVVNKPLTRFQQRKERKRQRIALYGPFETTHNDVVKCHFTYNGTVLCAAFKQHGKLYISTEFRQLILDYNMCADSVSKIMTIQAARESGAEKIDVLTWQHFRAPSKYPFQLERGYLTFFSEEKKRTLEAYVDYFFHLAPVNERLVFVKTRADFLRQHVPIRPSSPILVHKNYTGLGVLQWASSHGRSTLIGKVIYGDVLFPFDIRSRVTDKLTTSREPVACPYMTCRKTFNAYGAMRDHVNGVHLKA